jgi:hypothetical protein
MNIPSDWSTAISHNANLNRDGIFGGTGSTASSRAKEPPTCVQADGRLGEDMASLIQDP